MIFRIERGFQELVPDIRSNAVLLERTNPRPASEVLVRLTRDSGVALHRQIEASIRDAIRAGRLPRGTSLPPTRSLADELGVSRGVVVEAYQQLIAEGYLTSRAGGYTRVAIGPELPAGAPSPLPSTAAIIDFCPCKADGSQFPRAAWLRSLRRVLTEVSDEEFGYVGGRGAPALHDALAAYLNRVRGTSARAEQIVICNGYAQGIGLLIGVLAGAGAQRLALEDPSRGRRRAPARARGRPGGRRGAGRRGRHPRRCARPHRRRRAGAHTLAPVADRAVLSAERRPPCCAGRASGTRS